MILDGVLFVVQDDIEGGVLPEVEHPAVGTRLPNQVVLDDVLHPKARSRVSQVNNCEFDTHTLDQIDLTSRVLYKVPELLSLFKQVP